MTDVAVIIKYTNGKEKYLKFKSTKEAQDFIRSEGDHVLDWEYRYKLRELLSMKGY